MNNEEFHTTVNISIKLDCLYPSHFEELNRFLKDNLSQLTKENPNIIFNVEVRS